jgi:hypothetical protein
MTDSDDDDYNDNDDDYDDNNNNNNNNNIEIYMRHPLLVLVNVMLAVQFSTILTILDLITQRVEKCKRKD